MVTGGLLWWRSSWLVLGAYNIPANTDELRLYPRDHKLDNFFLTTVPQPAQVCGVGNTCDMTAQFALIILVLYDCYFVPSLNFLYFSIASLV